MREVQPEKIASVVSCRRQGDLETTRQGVVSNAGSRLKRNWFYSEISCTPTAHLSLVAKRGRKSPVRKRLRDGERRRCWERRGTAIGRGSMIQRTARKRERYGERSRLSTAPSAKRIALVGRWEERGRPGKMYFRNHFKSGEVCLSKYIQAL